MTSGIMSLQFQSRRSPVLGVNGAVACTQPLAAQIGLDILKHGGNAADSAVAMAAALNVTEPASTGIGGDCFCLFYNASSKKVESINGSGRAPGALSLDHIQKAAFHENGSLPHHHALNVTVPGAAAGWIDTLEKFGSKKLSVGDILQPAITLATEGFPVAPVSALQWQADVNKLTRKENPHGGDMLLNGNPPKAGELMKMPHLAHTFQELVLKGKKGFYEGPIAEAIIDTVQAGGGVMTLDDLKNHTSSYEDPIHTTYKGTTVWECPPNGQGITALMALSILEKADLKGLEPTSPKYIHLVAEALKLSFADSLQYCADPSVVKVPVEGLLSKKYASSRFQLVNPELASKGVSFGEPSLEGDTVYFCVVDGEGNACSFINSNYEGFGTGLVPKNCGFTLQSRGANFKIQKDHPNCPAGYKRPYHTIIPSMLTRPEDGALLAAYGVMGGFMQPQGHVQVVMNMVNFGMDPQTALDQPRLHVGVSQDGVEGTLFLEEGFPSETLTSLANMGHNVKGPVGGLGRAVFGRGQIITRGDWWAEPGRTTSTNENVLWAGSDPRADGMALSY